MNILIKVPLVLLGVLSTFLVFSCATVPEKRESVQMESPDFSGDEDLNLKPVIVDGVINFTDPEYRFMWNTAPDNGKLLFSSFIPRMEYRDKELGVAISEAARQASIMYNAKVDAKFAVKSNNRDLGFLESIAVQYDKAMAGDLKSKIKVRNYFLDNEGTYVLSELDGVNFKGEFSNIFGDNDEPSWLINIPEIPGYLVSVGSVQRSRYKIDSIRKADEQALANLAKQVSVVVKVKRSDLDSEVSGTAFSETNFEVTSTFIKGFYVLGRWSTDNGNTYHTLAVCQENQ